MASIQTRKAFWIYVCVAVAAVALLNIVARHWFFRIDLTDNNAYSLSPSSKSVLQKVDDLLTAKVYFSENLPGQYGNNQRYLQDILEEYAAYSNGNLRFEFYRPDNDEKLSQEAMKYGINPVQLQVIENDKLEIKRVYMGLVFLYEDQREVIPVVQTTTGLEYDITSKIKKMVDADRKVIGIARFTGQDIGVSGIQQQLSESYEVKMVPMADDVPGDVELLLVSGVEDSVAQEELDHLLAFTERGGNLLMAQTGVSASLQTQTARPIASNIYTVLEPYGVSVEKNFVLDAKCNQVTVSQTRGFFRVNTAVEYPFFPVVQNFGTHEIVSGLEQVGLLFASEINWDATDSSSTVQPLFYTSDNSSTMAGRFNINPIQNPALEMLNEPGKVVGVYATAQFPETGATSQLVLVSDSSLLLDDGGASMRENVIFTMNASDVLIGDRGLVALRSREVTTRPLLAVQEGAKTTWKTLNIVLPALLVVAYGLLQWRLEASRTKRLEELYG